MAKATSYSSNSSPSLGTSICHRCGPGGEKKKKAEFLDMGVASFFLEKIFYNTQIYYCVVSWWLKCSKSNSLFKSRLFFPTTISWGPLPTNDTVTHAGRYQKNEERRYGLSRGDRPSFSLPFIQEEREARAETHGPLFNTQKEPGRGRGLIQRTQSSLSLSLLVRHPWCR